MLYRAATFGIVAFWVVMMVLLVRLETHPDASDILDVPVSYVARLMFKHAQDSLLTAREDEKTIGTVSIRPSITGSGRRSLEVSGALSIQDAMGARQRISFNGGAGMDAALRIVDFHLEMTMQETHYHLRIEGDVARKTLACDVLEGNRRILSQTLPLDATTFAPALLQSLGLDPAALPMISGAISPPAVTARETQISLRGEQLQAYEVTFHEGSTAVADLYITQLGQIVLAKISFGYSLTVEDYQ